MTARDEIRARLRAAREARRLAHGQPPPRYDEVWADGVAWARARSRGARRYLDREQVEYRRRVQWAALAAMPAPRSSWPLDARYSVRLDVYQHPQQRPDLDNVAKQIGDALNRLVWADDRRIDELIVRRFLERDDPRLEVVIQARR